MRRREFISLLGGAAAAWPLAAYGQQGRLPVVGVLRPNPKDTEPFVEPFRNYMKAIGWEETQYPLPICVDGGPQRARAPAGRRFRCAECRPHCHLARPGGNTTGVSILAPELNVKRLEVLHEFVPQARRIAVLADPSTISTGAQLTSAARDLGVELVVFEAHSPAEIGGPLDAITMAKVGALNVLASPQLYAARYLIIERMRNARLPAIYQFPEIAEEGGLLSYGPRLLLCFRHVVSLVDKLLRGAIPAQLPIEQPSKFELIVNLKTANAIGLTITPTLLLRADAVIE
jgi:putative tryptophan/tyrosine transport system substrate-binding protein